MLRSLLPLRLTAATALLVASAVSLPAAAHGRFPQSGLILVDPANPEHLVVRTTYGFITSQSDGRDWYWVCPEAVGFDGDNEDPAVVISADSRVLAGVFDGLSTTADGCGWSFVGGDLATRYFVDIIGDAAGQNIVALSANGVAANTFEVNLWGSTDAGATFAPLAPLSCCKDAGAGGAATCAPALPCDFLALTVGVAASDPNRIYLSGRDGLVATEAAILRSDDRGMSWQRKALPTAPEALPFVGAVHPGDPDRLFVGAAIESGGEITHFELLESTNGGDTFTTVFQRDNGVPAFALSPDGSQIAVGSDPDGLWIAPTDTMQFVQVNTIRIRCITWTANAIYACSDPFVNDFAVGKSLDGGTTFEPLMLLSSPCGPPPECAAGTTVGDECIPRWPQEKNELGAQDCGTTGGSVPPPANEGDCSCSLPGGERHATAALIAMVAAALALAWRRPRRGR